MICIVSFKPYIYLYKVGIIIPILQVWKLDPEKLRDLVKVTQLVFSRARF